MKRTLALWLCVLCFTALSQPVIAAEVSGTVYSGGSPVANLTITVKGTTVTTKTGPNGRYQLQLQEGAHILVVRGKDFPVKVEKVPVRFDIQL